MLRPNAGNVTPRSSTDEYSTKICQWIFSPFFFSLAAGMIQAVQVAACALLLAAAPGASVLVNISNTAPRLDAGGQILAAHDGNVLQFTAGGPYYFFGMSYGRCSAPGRDRSRSEGKGKERENERE